MKTDHWPRALPLIPCARHPQETPRIMMDGPQTPRRSNSLHAMQTAKRLRVLCRLVHWKTSAIRSQKVTPATPASPPIRRKKSLWQKPTDIELSFESIVELRGSLLWVVDSGMGLGEEGSVSLTLDTEQQLTIKWKEPLGMVVDDVEYVLPPGHCNLYQFPAVTIEDEKSKYAQIRAQMMDPSINDARVLSELLIAAASSPLCTLFEKFDAVGAYPIHALAIANTDIALDLCTRIITVSPHLVTQVHASTEMIRDERGEDRGETGLFAGESLLHVAAINRKEDFLQRLLHEGRYYLPPDEYKKLLCSKATGSFFEELPMRLYGGTVLAYCCIFGLKKVCGALGPVPPLHSRAPRLLAV